MSQNIEKLYQMAKEIYAGLGVDTEKVMEELSKISVSMHCWQGDDGVGLEIKDSSVNTGIMATGNYMGRARNAEELRNDALKAYSLIPGKRRFNLHSMYAETSGKRVERNEYKFEYYENWINWAKQNQIGIDFNPTVYNHPMMKDGYSISSPDKAVRDFWIEHINICRDIAFKIGKELNSQVMNNIWISDGSKDICIDKMGLRTNLKNSLDTIFANKYDEKYLVDALEPKLFGIGTESFVVGSMEFYLGYALLNNVAICLDAGHFHPTELISEKLSSILQFTDKALLHVSRGVRWDSDHVTILNDEVYSIFQEIKRANAYGKVRIATDFFDASINRISAWVIGLRSTLKGIMYSLLEPTDMLKKLEMDGDVSGRLAMLEELKTLPFGAVWDMYCLKNDVPVGTKWIDEVRSYERSVLSKRV